MPVGCIAPVGRDLRALGASWPHLHIDASEWHQLETGIATRPGALGQRSFTGSATRP
jgi:hypothetical protein